MTGYLHVAASLATDLPPAMVGQACAVRGCDSEARFAVVRTMPRQGREWPKVALLGYCAKHYGTRPGR